MIQARDIMTSDPICIHAENLVSEAVQFLLKNFMSSAPVIDKNGNVVGQMSELNLIRAFVKTQVHDPHQIKVMDFKELFTKPEFVMTGTSLADVVIALLKCPLHRVLVKDGRNRLVGIISPKDILRTLSGYEGGNLTKKMKELEMSVQKLNQSLEQTQEGLDKYRNLFENSPFMMHSVDAQGVILAANPRLHEFLEYNPEELVGKSIFDIYPVTIHEVIRKELDHLVDHGSQDLSYSSFISKSGDVKRVEIISSSIKDAQGHLIGTISLSSSIDSEKLLRTLHGVLGS